jgi:protein ImuA
MEFNELSSLGVFHLQPKARPKDIAFPLGLGEGSVHEVCETEFGDMAALTGFVLAARAPRAGAVFWVSQTGLNRDHGDILHAGFSALRAERPLVLQARPRKLSHALWMIEEAIRSSAVGLVVAEIEDADFTASRRLALASVRSGVPVILLMPYTRQGSTAAAARWRVQPLLSAPNPFDPNASGHVRWQAVLERSRLAPHMTGQIFNLELNNETLSLSVVSRLAADTLTARQDRGAEDPQTAQIHQFG